MDMDTPRTHLGETGQIYVTHRAAEQYARWRDVELEAGRQELTAYLVEAAPSDTAQTPERWRYRRNSTRIDITARVVRDGPLAVVVAVTVRGYQSRRGGQRPGESRTPGWSRTPKG